MFSGIVEEMGRTDELRPTPEGLLLTVACETVVEGTRVGDSIAVDGVCLTVVSMTPRSLSFHIQPVTARLSRLGSVRVGTLLNLERAVAAGQRLGGHYVQGHVDATGKVVAKRTEGGAVIVTYSAPDAVQRYVVVRGFVAVNGVSLTVMALDQASFSVSLVHHTQQSVNLAQLPVGAPVNLEADVLAKYVERLLEGHRQPAVSSELLQQTGFLERTD